MFITDLLTPVLVVCLLNKLLTFFFNVNVFKFLKQGLPEKLILILKLICISYIRHVKTQTSA